MKSTPDNLGGVIDVRRLTVNVLSGNRCSRIIIEICALSSKTLTGAQQAWANKAKILANMYIRNCLVPSKGN